MSSFLPPADPEPPIVSYIDRLSWRLRSRKNVGIDQPHPGWVTDILDTYPPEGMSITPPRSSEEGWQLLVFRKFDAKSGDGKIVAKVLGSDFATDDDAKAAAQAHIEKGPIPR